MLRKVRPAIRYLRQLHERMTTLQFPAVDPLRLRVLVALDGLEALEKTLEQLAKVRSTRDDYLLGLSPRDYKRQRETSGTDRQAGKPALRGTNRRPLSLAPFLDGSCCRDNSD